MKFFTAINCTNRFWSFFGTHRVPTPFRPQWRFIDGIQNDHKDEMLVIRVAWCFADVRQPLFQAA